jgi:acyl carrier protein
MNREDIIKSVNAIFVERFEFEESELTADKIIFDDLELDSLDMVDMIVGLQQKFGIPLRENKAIREVKSLGDVYDLFEKLVAEHPEIADKL